MNSSHLDKFLAFTERLSKKQAATPYEKWRFIEAERFTVNHKRSISGSRFKRLRRKLWADKVLAE